MVKIINQTQQNSKDLENFISTVTQPMMESKHENLVDEFEQYVLHNVDDIMKVLKSQ